MKRPSNQDSDGEGGRAVSSDGNGQVKSFQEVSSCVFYLEMS